MHGARWPDGVWRGFSTACGQRATELKKQFISANGNACVECETADADWVHSTSAPGLGSSLSHLHRDWASPHATPAPGLGLTPGHICAGQVSVNLGTLLCIECSGVHRSLGSHISKVRARLPAVQPCRRQRRVRTPPASTPPA